MKVTKKAIAERLDVFCKIRRVTNLPRGEGCPFVSIHFGCWDSCGVIFLSIGVDHCPCYHFKKSYVLRRCDLFIKKYLTSD